MQIDGDREEVGRNDSLRSPAGKHLRYWRAYPAVSMVCVLRAFCGWFRSL